MSAAESRVGARATDTGIQLFGFTIGHVNMPMSFFIDGEDGVVRAPVTAFLIDHPKGLALFDTGLGPRFERPVGAALESFIDLEAGGTMDVRLRGIGVDPADVRWIIASHLHADHSGGNSAFPNATIIIQESELD
ncbi:MAG TPA: MBL fold metallo-hydrolase [Sphingobium sp.]